jgi:hypothetical protein
MYEKGPSDFSGAVFSPDNRVNEDCAIRGGNP